MNPNNPLDEARSDRARISGLHPRYSNGFNIIAPPLLSNLHSLPNPHAPAWSYSLSTVSMSVLQRILSTQQDRSPFHSRSNSSSFAIPSTRSAETTSSGTRSSARTEHNYHRHIHNRPLSPESTIYVRVDFDDDAGTLTTFQIKSIIYKHSFKMKRDNSNEECSICLDVFKHKQNVSQLPCNKSHLFHATCILNWVENGNDTCPLCRCKISG